MAMDHQNSNLDMSSALRALSRKTILVTGAGGFIGSAVTDLLASLSVKVRALLGAPGVRVWEPRQTVEACKVDIRDLGKMCEFAKGADIVIHAAGPASVRLSFDFPAECASIHAIGTMTLMEACRRSGVSRVVYISSAEVYGRPSTNCVQEDHPVGPLSPYGAAKAAAEIFVRTMASASKIEHLILRPFSVFGPRQSPDSLIATILRQAKQGQCIWLNDLRPVRDYCYVHDLVEAIALACMVNGEGYVVNIGSGEGSSVEKIAKLILRLQQTDIPVKQTLHSERPPDTEIYQLVADVRKAKALLGWEPRTLLTDGLRETIAWMKQSGDS